MQVTNNIYKVFISKYGCPKVAIPWEEGKIVITMTAPFYVADIPEQKELIRRLQRHPFLSMTKDLHAVEALTYIFDPKNFPTVRKMLSPNSDAANMHKYKPEEEEIIIANLRKQGWLIMRLPEFNDSMMELDTAKKILDEHNYEFQLKEGEQDIQFTEEGVRTLNPLKMPYRIGVNAGLTEVDQTANRLPKYEMPKLEALTKPELFALAKENNIPIFQRKLADIRKDLVETRLTEAIVGEVGVPVTEPIPEINDNSSAILDTAAELLK